MGKWGKKRKNGEERKIRSDKKREVKPTIPVSLIRQIERLAFVTDQPVMFVGEMLCYEGIHTQDVIQYLSPYFRGHVRLQHATYFGYPEAPRPEFIDSTSSTTDRISIRFTQRDYEDIKLLSTTLDVTPSRAVAILLDASMRHTEIIQTMIKDFNQRKSFDDICTAEIRKLIKFSAHNSPYENQSWNSVLLKIVEEVKVGVRAARKTVFPINPKGIDTEKYQWSIDNVEKKPPTKKKVKIDTTEQRLIEENERLSALVKELTARGVTLP